MTKCNNVQKHQLYNNSRAMFQEVNSITRTFSHSNVLSRINWEVLWQKMIIFDQGEKSTVKTFADTMAEKRKKMYMLRIFRKVANHYEKELTGYKNLKDGKVPGCGGLTAEMIKLSVKEGIDVYHHLCREIWHTGKWPFDWKRAVFIPLPKKEM